MERSPVAPAMADAILPRDRRSRRPTASAAYSSSNWLSILNPCPLQDERLPRHADQRAARPPQAHSPVSSSGDGAGACPAPSGLRWAGAPRGDRPSSGRHHRIPVNRWLRPRWPAAGASDRRPFHTPTRCPRSSLSPSPGATTWGQPTPGRPPRRLRSTLTWHQWLTCGRVGLDRAHPGLSRAHDRGA